MQKINFESLKIRGIKMQASVEVSLPSLLISMTISESSYIYL